MKPETIMKWELPSTRSDTTLPPYDRPYVKDPRYDGRFGPLGVYWIASLSGVERANGRVSLDYPDFLRQEFDHTSTRYSLMEGEVTYHGHLRPTWWVDENDAKRHYSFLVSAHVAQLTKHVDRVTEELERFKAVEETIR